MWLSDFFICTARNSGSQVYTPEDIVEEMSEVPPGIVFGPVSFANIIHEIGGTCVSRRIHPSSGISGPKEGPLRNSSSFSKADKNF